MESSWICLSVFIGIVIHCEAQHYTNQWAVHVEGGEDVARKLAGRHGFAFIDTIMPDYYHFQHQRVSKRSLDASSHLHSQLALEPEVRWVEQQVSKKRVKRDAAQSLFNDPMWPRLWYMHRDGGLDMNVVDVYQKWGITGHGSVVSILDDGIEKDHPDLMKNYDPSASYDVNDHDSDPQPRYDFSNENRHGTRCAGEVAAQANNEICGTGIAFEAGVGGVRMLDGDVTDAVEAQSISLNPQHIHIYSASWGPDDDGRTVDGPGPLARKAFFDGISKGRRGLGSIYVWASGNGGRNGDSCSCDGYTNSVYTLSISSASENGLVPWYSEACASTLATTYSSGSPSERQILTTDLHHLCTETHTGTSASAPLAAGICALALHANPHLTWRDMQYLVVLTAREANLQADDWVINGIGRKVSHHYGFGLMNAAGMVELAFNWTSLPDQHRCEVTSQERPRALLANSMEKFTLQTDGCMDSTDLVESLEHVQVSVTLGATRRGEVELALTSPSGTRSLLLARRAADTSGEGLTNWVMMTTHCWGEQPTGSWTLTVHTGATIAQLSSWSLILFGTSETPRVLINYQTSTAVHSSSTQTRQASMTSQEVTITRPPIESSAASTTSALTSQEVTITRPPIESSAASTTSTLTSQEVTITGPSNKSSAVSATSTMTLTAAAVVDSSISTVTSSTSLSTVQSTSDKVENSLSRNQDVVASSVTSPDVINSGTAHCINGFVMFEGKCHIKCPDGFFTSDGTLTNHNRTVDRELVHVADSICIPCAADGDCSSLSDVGSSHWLAIAATGVVCVGLVVVLLVLLVKRCMCKETEYEALPYRRSHFHVVDVIGLHDKHLLSSDSESSDELDQTETVGVAHSPKIEIP